MQLKFLCNEQSVDEQFCALLALGITYALKEHMISVDDAWNWFLNIKTLDTLKAMELNEKLILAIHLGTELDNVKRIVPSKFDSSCNEIINILKRVLKENSHTTNEIKYFLELQ